ncbi:MAG: NADPH-dependent reductase protein [Rhizobium sp.]|nr:NADPH-dependent reductase protein [Rhizobium sp.]
MQDSFKIAILIGSARQGRIADRVMKWLMPELRRHPDFTYHILDAREFETADRADPSYETVIHNADGVIVVTPEYNHSFPAPLKAMIDALGEPWHRKPVAFVCYGGISGGLRAIEQLKLVFAELGMVSVREVVSISSPWSAFSPDGVPTNPDRLNAAVLRMVGSLLWWTQALSAARAATAKEVAA